MKLQGYHVVILCCLLIQFSALSATRYAIINSETVIRVSTFAIQGLTFLLYPILGHLADVCLTRHWTIKCSFVIIITSATMLLLGSMIDLALNASFNSKLYTIISHHFYRIVSAVIIAIAEILYIIGIGLFEANAIQFGLDQLLEAPTQQLVAFIHWYYWSQNIGSLVMYVVAAGLGLFVKSCHEYTIKGYIGMFLFCALISTTAIATLCLFCRSRKHFYIQRAGFNPFKTIYKVLRYAWKHKVPENRSAFTYWEEDIPPRIDLGKEKYGGPFTTEEVEDTKTFLRILPLLLSLFGFHLAGDGYSAPEQFQRTSCPSLPVLLLIVYNPIGISTIVTVVGIPLYRLVIRKVLPCLGRVLMLMRMWIGLFLSLLQVTVNIIVAVNHDTAYWQQHHTSLNSAYPTSIITPTKICYIIRTGYKMNGTCEIFDDPIDNIYLWFIIPQLLNGFSSLFVSMTALEFICAQAPRTTQGMLIGLWYATFSIRYLTVDIVDTYVKERRSWLIYEGVKGFLILVSMVLFSCLSRHYRYRQRDEIVNVQWMIEEIFERRMDQEEEYNRECRALLANERVHIYN